MAPRKSKYRVTGNADELAPEHANVSSLSAPPERTDEQLNLAVLSRHNPEVKSLEYVAPYAVVYIFSPESQGWEKSGIEGTAFVCGLWENHESIDRFSIVVLNRRGLDNFTMELTSEEEVEFTEEYIILQSTDGHGNPSAYGLWIFSEPPPSSTSHHRERIGEEIRRCVQLAEQGRVLRAKAKAQAGNGYGHDASSAGRQIDLMGLFNQQQMSQGPQWNVQGLQPDFHGQYQSAQPQASGSGMFAQAPDTAFFLNNPHQSGPHNTTPFADQHAVQHSSPAPRPEVDPQKDHLLSLFRDASSSQGPLGF